MGSAWRLPTLLDLPPDCGVSPLRRIVVSVLCLGGRGEGSGEEVEAVVFDVVNGWVIAVVGSASRFPLSS